MEWHTNRKTTPPPGTPQEKTLPNNSASIAAETEETRRLLIGAMLTQSSCTMQFATLLTLAVRSNSATPKMVEALSFALSEMVSLSMNMCGQLRALTITLTRLRLTTQNDIEVERVIEMTLDLMDTIAEEFEV